MDDRRFDEWTRSFDASASRRGTVQLLVGGLLGILVAQRGGEAAAARCARPGRKCGRGKKCCQGARCRKGRCRCRPGFTNCNRRCLDLRANPERCGACDTACRADQVCAASACTCASGRTECAGTCRNLEVDSDNCGGCGVACTGLERCQAGDCCLLPGLTCDTDDDCCCGASFCVDLVIFGQKCCGISGRTPCDVAICCSGECGPNGLCA